MYTVSEKGAELIMSDCRSFKARMVFTNGTVLQDEVAEVGFSMQTSADDIRPGDVIPRNLTAQLTGISETLTGQTFLLYFDILDVSDNLATHAYLSQYTHGELHGYTHGAMPGSPAQPEPIPAGRYKVTACTKQGDRWSLEAHDLLYASDKPYTSRLTYPTALANVERELCNGLGIDLPASSAELAVYTKPSGCTYREVLGFLAALQGKCCITDRQGRLAYKGLEDAGYTIEPSRAADPEVSQAGIYISRITCIGAGGYNYTISIPGASGRTMTFEDPLVDTRNFPQVSSALSHFLGLTYTPLTISHRLGDPRLDILDLVTVKRFEDEAEFKVPLTSISLSFDGGISCELAATASNDTQEEAKQQNIRPMSRRIAEAADQAASQVEAEMQEQVNNIIGENGGYVVTKFNQDGQPIATYYSDNLDIERASKLLVINDQGIAGTDQGLRGTFNVAISIDGTINASRILTGVLTAIMIKSLNGKSKIDLNTGELDFGDGVFTVDSDGKVTAKSIDIEGGSINIESSSESDDRITLTYDIYKFALAAYGFRSEILQALQGARTACVTQYNCVQGEIYRGGSWTKVFKLSAVSGKIETVGSIEADGNINAGMDISAGGNITAGGNAAVSGVDGAVFANDLYWKDSDSAGGYRSMRTFYDYVMNYINNHP